MAELKTQLNDGDVRAFLNSVEHKKRREDSLVLLDVFTEVTGEEAKMWGKTIVGFGSYHYKSERSSQEGDWMKTGFSPRKQSLTLYIMPGFKQYESLMAKLGKHKTGKSCLYINKLEDVDMTVLKELIKASMEETENW